MPTDDGRSTAAQPSSGKIRTGATSSCSMSTSTVTTGRGSGPAIRRDGSVWWHFSWTYSVASMPRPSWKPNAGACSKRSSRSRSAEKRRARNKRGNMFDLRYPALYQINTRVWLTELSRALGKRATLDDILDAELDRLAELGFDWVWFLSVWQTGPAARAISRANPDWRREFAATLPDLEDEDIVGSGFAIQDYTVHRDLGGAAALARLRVRLQKRGLKLMLDFVPNHLAPDHRWIDEHPDYFVHGSESDL